MIVSFNPIISAHRNIICAGRDPDAADRAAIQSAAAVILPQGCTEALYRLCRGHCPHVFPNLDARFDFPGKIGQIRLFQQLGLAHPATRVYANLDKYRRNPWGNGFPVVVKLNWGGQGHTVFKAGSQRDLNAILGHVAACEKTGQSGFLVQALVRSPQRSVRVVLVGTFVASYWRIQTRPGYFGTSVDNGARIDHEADPHIQARCRQAACELCRRTGLQLAAFDYIFEQMDGRPPKPEPLILEINYFFGRSGLGGSQRYYRILRLEVKKWLKKLNLG
jgi:ribosomal protein S6--L-glutamate ligase